MDIKDQNKQIMIKMIIDKLHNNTLQEYYKGLSEKIEKQGKEIEKQGEKIETHGKEKEEHEDDVRRLKMKLDKAKQSVTYATQATGNSPLND